MIDNIGGSSSKTSKKDEKIKEESVKEEQEEIEVSEQVVEAIMEQLQSKGRGRDGSGTRYNSVLISGRIDEETSREVIRALLNLEKADPTAEIIIYINSYGGYVDDAMAIYDTMNFITNDITTVCIGKAMSAGALLLSAGKKGSRYITPNSRIMIHKVQGGTVGDSDEIEVEADEIKRMNIQFLNIMAKNCGMTIKQLEDNLKKKKNIYLIGKAAKRFGIVDHIAMKRPKILKG